MTDAGAGPILPGSADASFCARPSQSSRFMVEVHHTDAETVITLRPNQSATWEETRVFVLAICAVTLVIGVFWTLVGAWVVLPFSGLEAALVAYLFYRVCQSTYQRQVITCSKEVVKVQFGMRFPKRSWLLQRDRTRLAVGEPRHALDAPSLVIADTEQSLQLGKFLNRDDMQIAIKAFRQIGLPVRSRGESGDAHF